MSATTTTTDVPEVVDEAQVKKREGRGRLGVFALGLTFVLALGCFGVYTFFTASDVSTDDAAVDAEIVTLAVRTAGLVKEVRVTENSVVHKGDVLLVLDDAELSAKVRQAEAAVAAAQAQADLADAQVVVSGASARGGLSTAEAQVLTMRAQAGSAEAQVQSAQAAVTRAEAQAVRARTDADRMDRLLADGGVTKQAVDSAHAARDSADADERAAHAQLEAAVSARAAARSRVAEASGTLDSTSTVDAKVQAAEASARLAHANLDSAVASLELAKMNLSYATVLAPADGVATRVSGRVGQLLVSGQQIASLVPQHTYIVANFKETQIGDMEPGDPVDVTIDSYGRQKFEGVVESVAPGTGSRFSLLAPDNASGNFVKVVQRVPVRIAWKTQPADLQFRPGQSAVVTVHTGG